MKKEFLEKLIKVQNELKVPKGKFNSFGKYKYRSAEDILETVKPIIFRIGLYINLLDEIIYIGERHYVKAVVTLYDENDCITAVGFAREPEEKKGMDSSQITGTASSYARKYALNGIFAIDESEADPDSDNQHIPAESENITSKKMKYFQILIKETGADKEKIKERYNVSSLNQLTEEQLEEAVKLLENKKNGVRNE